MKRMDRSRTPDCFADIEQAFNTSQDVKGFQRGTPKYATIHGTQRPASANFFGERQAGLSLPQNSMSSAQNVNADSDEDDRASLASIRSTISLAPEAFQRMGASSRIHGEGGGGGTRSHGRRRRSSSVAKEDMPYVKHDSMTKEKPLGTVYLLLGNQCKKAIMPNQITSLITIRALFVRAFPDQLSLPYLEKSNVAIYFHDQAKDVFRELEDLGDLRDKSILKVFETNEDGVPVRSGNELHKHVDAGGSKFGVQPNSSSTPQPASATGFDLQGASSASSSTLSAASCSAASSSTAKSKTPSSSFSPTPSTSGSISGASISSSQPNLPPPPPSYAKVMSSQGAKIPAAAATILSNQNNQFGQMNKAPSMGNMSIGSPNQFQQQQQLQQQQSSLPKASTLKKPSKMTSAMKQRSASMANLSFTNGGGGGGGDLSKKAYIRPITPNQLAVGTNFKSSVIGLKLKTEDLKSKIDSMKAIQVAYMKSIDTTIQQAADMMMKAVQSTAESGASGESEQGSQLMKELQEEHPVRLQRLQVSKFHRAFSSDMNKVSQELSELETTVEEIRSKVINEHCLINAASIDTLASNLNTITEAYNELKKTFPVLQQRMRVVIQTEMQLAQMEEKYLDTEQMNIENSLQRCQKLTGTLVTMKRLASVQQQSK